MAGLRRLTLRAGLLHSGHPAVNIVSAPSCWRATTMSGPAITITVDRTVKRADGSSTSTNAVVRIPLVRPRAVPAAAQSSLATRTAAPSGFVVGTLNILGALENPMEFLALKDDAFMAEYSKMQEGAEQLTLATVLEYTKGMTMPSEVLQVAWAAFEKYIKEEAVCNAHGTHMVWPYFREEVLNNDNKLLGPRLNLIAKAMSTLSAFPAPVHEGNVASKTAKLQWHLLSEEHTDTPRWQAYMDKLATQEAYTKDPQLFIWDLTCSVVACERKQHFLNICGSSIQNPANIPTNARTLFQKIFSVGQGPSGSPVIPVVLGMQEWPEEESSLQRQEYVKLLAENNCELRTGTECDNNRTESVAVAFCKSIGRFEWLTGKGKIDPAEVMAGCIAEEKTRDPQHVLQEKDEKGLLLTTAKKTMACRLGNKLSVIVIHAKEAKNESVIKVQAAYAAAMIKLVPAPAVVCADMNTKSRDFAGIFAANVVTKCAVHDGGVAVVPDAKDPRATTTSKHRSLLHGQTYDKKKTLRTVALLKDRIIGTKGGGVGVVAPSGIFPDLGDINGVIPTLPTNEWPSDHALVWTAYRPYS